MPTWRDAEASFIAAKEAKGRGENVREELAQTRQAALAARMAHLRRS